MKQDQRLGTESVVRLFIKLAVPAVLAQMVNLIYNVVDRIYIGHLEGVGRLALTGVGVCLPVMTFVMALAMLCGMGGAPKAAISMGKGDYDTAERILGNCFSLCLVIGIVFTVVVEIFAQPLLMVFGASEETIGYGLEYIRVYLIGTTFVLITSGLNSFITTQGSSRTAMFTVLIGAVLNIGLDPLFMFVFKMGVRGAAVATVISQAVSAAWVMLFLTGKRTSIKIKLKNMVFRAKTVLPCMVLGLSSFIMISTESLLSVCFNSSLQKYGGDVAVGAMTILSSLMQFSLLPTNGFTQGAQPIVSYNFGAGNKQRVKKAFTVLLVTCLSYSMLYTAMIIIMPETIARMFNDDPALIEYVGWAARIYMGAMGIFGVQVACQQTFLALGNAKNSLFLALLRKIFLILPLVYIMPQLVSDKAMGVFLAEPVADVIAVTTTAIMFAVCFKKALRSMDEKKKEIK